MTPPAQVAERVVVETADFLLPNGQGWLIHLKRTVVAARHDRRLRPVLLLPGYGMNSFILGYHPDGASLEETLAEAGFEVWSADLRHQGPSRRQVLLAPPPSLAAWATVDLPAVLGALAGRTRSRADRVDVIGCSLGGSVVYAHLALLADQHRIGSVVTIGAPFRWVAAHPLFRLAFRSPRLAGRVPFVGTRPLARLALPWLARIPGLLDPYLNRRNVDLSEAAVLTRTVDDPHPRVNREIARWMADGDLIVDGVRVGRALAGVTRPLLLVVANRDGIVPPPTSLTVLDAWGDPDVQVLRVGADARWYAHADLFIGRDARILVFDPIARWLRERSP